ncbi:hypothetical protein BGZ52_005618, partial [Haplosporangium bisporale]
MHYDPYWIQVIDNIMLDQSIYYGRKAQQEVKVKLKRKAAWKVLSDEAISRRRHLSAVTPAIQQHMEAVNFLMLQQTSRQQSMSTKISQISKNIEKLQVNQDQHALHTEQRNQHILEDVTQSM